ncbi:hypothetical protein X760_23665 [Mesorhizobium sp. LSHC422A00]|nr:hypothetical protein X762_30765 [Mesorhizobium sp. LSHC426A00]ESX48489.1 hypothetical protein X761_28410 [Mesorhizobium sp. LSHC424B00]ESX57045.1 hypothetical protein X760_23665 [Mesorhizobium sp. LSHC422A00]ESX65386.1 hypothetical protein X758_29980 [Mesorhizobium sp. LSHC416B00]
MVAVGDVAGLLARFAELKRKSELRTGRCFPLVVIQEAGLDGFWIHRVLEAEGIESHIIDPASIATSRRRRRAKTDRIDGEALGARTAHLIKGVSRGFARCPGFPRRRKRTGGVWRPA